jgi:hypothetical protein
MTDQRLEQILRARGIVGVVLSPVTTAESAVTLGWDWRQFAPAVIGNITWMPELHHAGHHHFLAMRLALLELAKLGCNRPVALIEATVHERNKHAYVAGFLAHHPQAASARGLVRVASRGDATDLGPWLQAARPDALIVSHTDLLGFARDQRSGEETAPAAGDALLEQRDPAWDRWDRPVSGSRGRARGRSGGGAAQRERNGCARFAAHHVVPRALGRAGCAGWQRRGGANGQRSVDGPVPLAGRVDIRRDAVSFSGFARLASDASHLTFVFSIPLVAWRGAWGGGHGAGFLGRGNHAGRALGSAGELRGVWRGGRRCRR